MIKRRNVEFRRFKPYQSAVATEAKAKGSEEIFDFTGGKPEGQGADDSRANALRAEVCDKTAKC